MSTFEEYNDMIEALLVLFKEYLPKKEISVSDVEWWVTRMDTELVQWVLDDLHITLSLERNKVVLHCPEALGRKYLRMKVELLYNLMKEIGDAD